MLHQRSDVNPCKRLAREKKARAHFLLTKDSQQHNASVHRYQRKKNTLTDYFLIIFDIFNFFPPISLSGTSEN